MELKVNSLALSAWRHQAITWTSADLSTPRFYGIHTRALSWEARKIHTKKTRMEFEFLKSDPDLPGTNELKILPLFHCSHGNPGWLHLRYWWLWWSESYRYSGAVQPGYELLGVCLQHGSGAESVPCHQPQWQTLCCRWERLILPVCRTSEKDWIIGFAQDCGNSSPFNP